MEKHFLPEWLEKYPVFGLEMKLAWRRLLNSRIVRLLSIRREIKIANRIAKESALLVIVFIVLSILFLLMAFPGLISDYIFKTLGYMFYDYIYPLAMLLFVIIAAIQGSDCYNVANSIMFYRLVATTGIKTSRICSEALLSGVVKFTGIAVLLSLLLLLSLWLQDSFFSNVLFIGAYLLLILGFLVIGFFIYIVSSTFATTRLELVSRRFAVLGFWLLTVLLPVLIGYLIMRICENTQNRWYYEYLDFVYVYLASIFPLGSLLTFPEAISGNMGLYYGYCSWHDFGFVAVSLLCQFLYSLIAIRISQKLFARRLSE